MINIDYRKDKLLTEFSHKTLQDRYLVGDEVSPQEGFARAAQAFADDEAHAQRLYDYASKSISSTFVRSCSAFSLTDWIYLYFPSNGHAS